MDSKKGKRPPYLKLVESGIHGEGKGEEQEKKQIDFTEPEVRQTILKIIKAILFSALDERISPSELIRKLNKLEHCCGKENLDLQHVPNIMDDLATVTGRFLEQAAPAAEKTVAQQSVEEMKKLMSPGYDQICVYKTRIVPADYVGKPKRNPYPDYSQKHQEEVLHANPQITDRVRKSAVENLKHSIDDILALVDYIQEHHHIDLSSKKRYLCQRLSASMLSWDNKSLQSIYADKKLYDRIVLTIGEPSITDGLSDRMVRRVATGHHLSSDQRLLSSTQLEMSKDFAEFVGEDPKKEELLIRKRVFEVKVLKSGEFFHLLETLGYNDLLQYIDWNDEDFKVAMSFFYQRVIKEYADSFTLLIENLNAVREHLKRLGMPDNNPFTTIVSKDMLDELYEAMIYGDVVIDERLRECLTMAKRLFHYDPPAVSLEKMQTAIVEGPAHQFAMKLGNLKLLGIELQLSSSDLAAQSFQRLVEKQINEYIAQLRGGKTVWNLSFDELEKYFQQYLTSDQMTKIVHNTTPEPTKRMLADSFIEAMRTNLEQQSVDQMWGNKLTNLLQNWKNGQKTIEKLFGITISPPSDSFRLLLEFSKE